MSYPPLTHVYDSLVELRDRLRNLPADEGVDIDMALGRIIGFIEDNGPRDDFFRLADVLPLADRQTPTPLVLRLRADEFELGCQRAAALIPYLAEPHAGILMIPEATQGEEATQSETDIAPHAFSTAGGFGCMYCGRPARDHVFQEVDPS